MPGGDPALRDPYAAAAERLRERRAAEAQEREQALPEYRPRLSRVDVVRRVLLVGGLAALVGFVAYAATAPPAVEPDCDTVRLVLNQTELRGGGLVRFRITGPAGEYAVAVDAANLTRGPDGRYRLDPRPGAPEGFRPVSDVVDADGCAGSGVVGLDDTLGTRTLTLFRLDAPGGPRAEVTEPVEVVAR